MPNLKLSYFDFNGGRGDSIRLALEIGEIPFEDHRIPVGDWPAVRETTPFHGVPVLEVDGREFTQSSAILRYVGTLVRLYPADPLRALRCDEVLDATEDLTTQIVATFGLPVAEMKVAREALLAGPLPVFLGRLQELLREGGCVYFCGDLTVADLKLVVLARTLGAGILDHIPTDLVARVAPDLARHADRILALPAVAAHYGEV